MLLVLPQYCSLHKSCIHKLGPHTYFVLFLSYCVTVKQQYFSDGKELLACLIQRTKWQKKDITKYRIYLLVLPHFSYNVKSDILKIQHYHFLSIFNQTHQVVITGEGTKVVLHRRALAMCFVGCVVLVSCMADSLCVCLPGATIGKGTVCT